MYVKHISRNYLSQPNLVTLMLCEKDVLVEFNFDDIINNLAITGE